MQLLPRIGERPFSIGVGDRVANEAGATGTVVATGTAVATGTDISQGIFRPRVLVQWDDGAPGDLENEWAQYLTRLDVEGPH